MGTNDKAIKIANSFIRHVKGQKLYGSEEIAIQTEYPNVKFLIKIFVSEFQSEVVFKKEESRAFIIISNGCVVGSKDEREFSILLDILEVAGIKLLERTIKRSQKYQKSPVFKIHRDKKEQMNRILDRYNDYGFLYEKLKDEKFKRKQERLIQRLNTLNRTKK